MILRSILNPDASGHASSLVPVWPVVEQTQLRKMVECWLITQPAHAALAGEIAAQLDPAAFPGIDGNTIRAIALHDAGWGPLDAADVQSSRAGTIRSANGFQPRSFIAAPQADIIRAWTRSIEVAEKISHLGAYIVSEHFRSIATAQIEGQGAKSKNETALRSLKKFVEGETARQKSLLKTVSVPPGFLQRLVEALQFSDLLSLYICCGAESSVEFPQQIKGEKIKLLRGGQNNMCSLKPSPFTREHEFSVSCIPHPKRKDAFGATYSLQVNREKVTTG